MGDLKEPMKECPQCGSDEGYYMRMYASGSVKYYIGFDGSERNNGDMYEHLNHKGGKVAYCSNCDKKLFKL
ncbi:hypothetical protein EEL32_12165 [Brevibacillus laterosporus]|nr:hypothetical protein [Brevibacillus laterosporus]TPG86860.1 hypothetical protein EEL32_12165 [Brevibacillus laterosporus]